MHLLPLDIQFVERWRVFARNGDAFDVSPFRAQPPYSPAGPLRRRLPCAQCTAGSPIPQQGGISQELSDTFVGATRHAGQRIFLSLGSGRSGGASFRRRQATRADAFRASVDNRAPAPRSRCTQHWRSLPPRCNRRQHKIATYVRCDQPDVIPEHADYHGKIAHTGGYLLNFGPASRPGSMQRYFTRPDEELSHRILPPIAALGLEAPNRVF